MQQGGRQSQGDLWLVVNFFFPGLKAPQLTRLQDACASHNEGGRAQADPVFVSDLLNGCKGFAQDAQQAGVDFVFAPEEARKILSHSK